MLSRLSAAFFFIAVAASSSHADTPPPLSKCIDCHPYEYYSVQSNGGKHKTEITCLDCHPKHFTGNKSGNKGKVTTRKGAIVQCSHCHNSTPHEQVANCQQCHTNPHMPLASLTFPLSAKAGCISCHQKQGEEFAKFKSKHAQHSCTFCHEKHHTIPRCEECHKPHSTDKQMADCQHCHPAHHPLQVNSGGYTPIKYCEPCHAKIAAELRSLTTRHGTLVCTNCHKGPHPPSIPMCQDCHGQPHSKDILAGTPSCKSCHIGPHRLVR